VESAFGCRRMSATNQLKRKPMPIYEYQCTLCEHKLEVLQKMSDDPLEDCPACDRPELKKLVSAASFRLKGKGWYETDFKTGDKKQLAESDSGKAPATSDGDSSKKPGTGDKAAAETGKSKPEKKSTSQQDSKSVSKKTAKPEQGSS
tara:strand:+ start:4075 stop:4515 length:441 start_codon:yes stop_codon:yes gene_type:complete